MIPIDAVRANMKLQWPLFLLAFLTSLFFVCGVILDAFAADTGIKEVLTEHRSVDQQRFMAYVKFQTERSIRIHEGAKTLYDIAKVSLGALIGALSQLVAFETRNKSSDSTASESAKKEHG